MSSFKFGQIKIASKDFSKQKQVTNIFMIDVNKVVLTDRASCNNGRDWRHIVGYQMDGETIIPLYIKIPKTIFSYGASQNEKSSAYTMQFSVSGVPE